MKKTMFLLACVFASQATFSAVSPMVNLDLAESRVEVQQVSYTVDLGDMTNMSAQEMENAISACLPEVAEEKLNCTVVVKGKLGAGPASVEIEVTVSGPCSEVMKEAKRIAATIIK